MGLINVLVVDDSVVVRKIVTSVLATDPAISVVGTAANGQIALSKLLQVAPDVTDERFHTPGDPDPRIVLLRQGGGLRHVVQVDGDLAGLVGACDGELTVGQITAGLAVLGEEEVGEVRTRLYPRVRDLIADGILRLP